MSAPYRSLICGYFARISRRRLACGSCGERAGWVESGGQSRVRALATAAFDDQPSRRIIMSSFGSGERTERYAASGDRRERRARDDDAVRALAPRTDSRGHRWSTHIVFTPVEVSLRLRLERAARHLEINRRRVSLTQIRIKWRVSTSPIGTARRARGARARATARLDARMRPIYARERLARAFASPGSRAGCVGRVRFPRPVVSSGTRALSVRLAVRLAAIFPRIFAYPYTTCTRFLLLVYGFLV